LARRRQRGHYLVDLQRDVIIHSLGLALKVVEKPAIR
jgi:hypothetical protein